MIKVFHTLDSIDGKVEKYFIDHTHEDIDKTIGINCNALMHITKEFLGDMMHTKQGHIVNR